MVAIKSFLKDNIQKGIFCTLTILMTLNSSESLAQPLTLTEKELGSLPMFFTAKMKADGLKSLKYALTQTGFKRTMGEKKVYGLMLRLEEARCTEMLKSILGSRAKAFATQKKVSVGSVVATIVIRSAANADAFLDTVEGTGQVYLTKGSNQKALDNAKDGIKKCLSASVNSVELSAEDITIIKSALSNSSSYLPAAKAETSRASKKQTSGTTKGRSTRRSRR